MEPIDIYLAPQLAGADFLLADLECMPVGVAHALLTMSDEEFDHAAR